MTDIIEKAADMTDYRKLFDKCEDAAREAQMTARSRVEQPWVMTAAVIRSLRDNTDSPRVCDELTRMLGEEG